MSVPPLPESPAPVPPDELLVGDIVRPLVARWRLLLGVPIAAALIGLLLAVVWPKSYMAQASFTPEQPASAGGSSAIANAIGNIGGLGSLMGSIGGVPTALGTPSASSPEFFAGILKSRGLRTATLTSAFDVPGEAGREHSRPASLRPPVAQSTAAEYFSPAPRSDYLRSIYAVPARADE